MQAAVPAIWLDELSPAARAGRITGRLLAAALIPVLVIALIYWGSGRSRQPPMPFSHAISRWWVWVAGVAAGGVLLVAGSLAQVAPAIVRQAALEATPSALPEPSPPPGWTLQRVAAAGFELALPDTWGRARADPAYFDADVAIVRQAHPDVADVLGRFNDALKGKGLKLIAVDPTHPSGYYTNVFVLAYDSGFGASLDSEASDYATGLGENASIQKPVAQRKVSVPVGPAVRLEAHAPGEGFTQISFLMIHAKNGKTETVALVLTCATDQLPATEAIIAQAVQSFRYLG